MTTQTTEPTRSAETSTPILDVLAQRWSPRAFSPEAEVSETALTAALEAARWSPSAMNLQPWRFIVGRRGDETYRKIVAHLIGGNDTWASGAPVLVVNVAETVDADGNPRPFAFYDLGQAVAHFSVQAHADGLYVHQMGGIDPAGLREAFDLPERFAPTSVLALGALGDPETLSEKYRAREVAPRQRLALDDIVLNRA